MRGTTVLCTLVVALVIVLSSTETLTAATLRPDFEDRLIASVGSPIALAFTPDGRMLVASQSGQLRVYKEGELLPAPALDFTGKICSNSERGLLGVAVDPNFATNHYVYLYYTFDKHGACPIREPDNPENPVNRVARFLMSGDTVVASSEKVLIDNIPSPHGAHNSGDLHFGKDGYLYVSTGDGECDYADNSGCAGRNDASRDRHVLLGKILRITRDGTIPPDNPYRGTNSARCNVTGRTDPGKICQETFALGLRNPFRMAFDPDASGTRFFINDVGEHSWDEIDDGTARADYAWNICEGRHDNPYRAGSVDCTAAPFTPPVYELSHSSGCSSITGGAFVPDGAWPPSYDGSYLFGDYVCNKIFELTPNDGGGFTKTEFASGLGQGGPIAMAFGPYGSGQALYYTTYANGGEVHRVAYISSGVNHAPNAVVSANPNYGDVPLQVSFDGSQSSDPDRGDALTTYIWDFGDETPTAETDDPAISHTYAEEGIYTATLTVRDTSDAESAATVRIYAGNTPPDPVILSPAPEKLFKVGESITLRGSAVDPQDGQLANGALSWKVLQHHNGDHTHPLFSETGNNLVFTAPPPEDIVSTDSRENYLEIKLTATDSKGLSKTITQRLNPKTVEVTFRTRPTGLRVLVDGANYPAAPHSFVSWEGYKLHAEAPAAQRLGGTTYYFVSWLDSGARSRDIITGAEPSVFTATYAACTITGTAGNDTLAGTSTNDVICGLSGNDILSGAKLGDIILGGAGNDTINGGGGNDTLRGSSGLDSVRGEGGADELYGEDNDDKLNSKDGVSGNDSLDGGPGTDTKVTDATEKMVVGFP